MCMLWDNVVCVLQPVAVMILAQKIPTFYLCYAFAIENFISHHRRTVLVFGSYVLLQSINEYHQVFDTK